MWDNTRYREFEFEECLAKHNASSKAQWETPLGTARNLWQSACLGRRYLVWWRLSVCEVYQYSEGGVDRMELGELDARSLSDLEGLLGTIRIPRDHMIYFYLSHRVLQYR